MKNLFLLALPFALATSLPAAAADWVIDPAASSIRFSGIHAGKDFSGAFGSWNGTIAFDPAKPEAGSATITIDLSSAATGDATYDKSLPAGDWFDSATNTTATFQSQGFKAGANQGNYVLTGVLSLRGKAVPVELPFTFSIDGEVGTAEGRAVVKRMDFGIGAQSDAAGSWVSLEIPVDIKVVAKRR
jgi:polyisoprenoid-binding protein YceI